MVALYLIDLPYINMALEFLTFIFIFAFFWFLMVLPILYDLNAKFRYCFKFAVYYCSIGLISGILIPVALLRPFHVSNLKIVCGSFRFISKILNIKWNIIAKENLKLKEPCIYIANRQSTIDLLGLSEILPYLNKCAVSTKKTVLYFGGPFGLLAWLCDSIFVDNKKNISNELNDENLSVWIFLEGTRTSTEALLSFEKAFYIAATKQLPIIPVVFSSYYFLDGERKVFDPGNVAIEVLSPIETKNLITKDIPKLIEDTNTRMLNVFGELSVQLTPPSVIELRRSYLSKCV